MNIKTIDGRNFDIDKERVLSFRNKTYYYYFKEFKPYNIREFIDYLMSGDILDWEWNCRGGYNTIRYTSSSNKEIVLHGNHGMTEILYGFEYGTLDPSEVLHDFIVFYLGCNFCDESTIEDRQQLYIKVKNLIEEGFSIKVVDHSLIKL
jgi:hypothetical protein